MKTSLIEKKSEPNLIQKLEKTIKLHCTWIDIEEKDIKDNKEYVTRIYFVKPMELVNFIQNRIKYLVVRGVANEGSLIYFYTKGYYKLVSEDEFKGFINMFIPYQLIKSQDTNEVFINLKRTTNFTNYEELNANEQYINFQDGLLNLHTWKLEQHNADILSTIQIPTKYKDVEASNPDNATNFHKYITTLCNNNTDTCLVLLECLGLIISNIYGYRTKKALFLVGAGDTGKSQLKNLVEYLVGDDNISNIDLKKMNERFGTASLYQKRLVGCNDMSYQRIEDMSIFKQLTGGDKIEIEFKGKSSFNFSFKGFLWFNCNREPYFGGDTGKWVYDRIMIITCNNVIAKEKQDPFLFNKLKEEKNEILKLSLAALKTLIFKNYNFEETPEMLEARERYEINNNTLLSFIKEFCEVYEEPIQSFRTPRSTFNRAYDSYIKEKNNNRGKIPSKDINLLLEQKFKETFIKSNGIVYMSKIKLTPSAKEELNYYE